MLDWHHSFSLQRLASQGGPRPQDYETFTQLLNDLAVSGLPRAELRSLWSEL